MNRFIIEHNPDDIAKSLCDQHIVKMPLEEAQMLNTAVRIHAPEFAEEAGLYKIAYANHPCTVWAGDSWHNFDWLANHAIGLLGEYYMRFGKEHACSEAIGQMNGMSWRLPNGRLPPFAQAMPDEFKQEDAVQAYRAYYHSKTFAKWEKGTDAPYWWMGVTA